MTLGTVIAMANSSCFTLSSFILIGIPGVENAHIWISIPFFLMYVIALLGNSSLIFIIKTESCLQQPMYMFLAMLAAIDIILSTTTMPKMLSIFWFNSREIAVGGCLVQMFFIHSLATMESGIFLAMAFDRYVAICEPLHHTTILTNPVVAKMGLVAVLRGVIYILPLPLLIITRFTYYKTNVISHTYCEHMAVVNLTCDDIFINNLYGLTIGFFVLILDSVLIAVSYFKITQVILGLTTLEARLKSFKTCSSHICAILAFYTPITISSLTHRFGHNVAPPVHILLANFYLLVPPVLNPVVYAVRTKQIRQRVLGVFRKREVISPLYTSSLENPH
ncbi:olfactory receptor 52M1-like [Rhinatrema bivittatum]|uniref:olfactory receptor 52M1-like n=1 Tax=Rhinatrema bivittatum TaxID=194408 RepID=UPI0011286F46|nr:olfactory receptor 52M1-like [Rhinatrema bivittatum]